MGEHEAPKPPFIPDTARFWLYTVGIAALSVLGVYGILDGEKIYAFNFLLAAFFGVAAKHTDRGTPAT
jgi:hypothetical protein